MIKPQKIQQESDITELVSKIGADFQRLETLLKRHHPNDDYLKTKVKIPFPKGYIRHCSKFRRKYPCHNEVIERNVAYALQLTEIVRWILNRFDIGLTAKEMLIKYGIVTVVSIIEALIYDRLIHCGIKPSKRLKRNMEKSLKADIISKELHDALQKLRERRDNIHLYRLHEREHMKYELGDYNKAIIVLNCLKGIEWGTKH